MRFYILMALSFLLFPVAHAAPVFYFFGADRTQVASNEIERPVTFSFVAGDPVKGLDGLAGAVLIDTLSGATYGTFGVGAQKGAYQITLTVNQILNVRPQEFTADGLEARDFTVALYNSAGEVTQQKIKVSFQSLLRWTPVKGTMPAEMMEYSRKYLTAYYGMQAMSERLHIEATHQNQNQKQEVVVEWMVGYNNNEKDTFTRTAIFNELKKFSEDNGVLGTDSGWYFVTKTFYLGCKHTDAQGFIGCWISPDPYGN